MGKVEIPSYLKQGFDKYKYILLVCIVGVILLLWPEAAETNKDAAPMIQPDQTVHLEQRIQALLENAEGVGRAQVLLTEEWGDETDYATDRTDSESRTESGYNASRQTELVTVSESGEQKPVAIRVSAPQYRGAVVICDGGDRGDVQLIVTRIVQSLTGLSTDKIVISKMK